MLAICCLRRIHEVHAYPRAWAFPDQRTETSPLSIAVVQRPIARARRLHATETRGVELDHTVYALDATTIDRCLSMIPWAHLRSTKPAVNRASGLMCGLRIALRKFYVARDYPAHLRRIRYRDPQTRKTLVFLTNHTLLLVPTICALYKSRWQVELLKQRLRENAVKTQV